ncbi:hypothetical protein H1S01_09230 [Heliobacterium chlorum]|uniref:Radical SAM core domain-containing protein n=1 Tax=Heliobacterium chlorum TaxID=2698 RepID=A0ABR7T3A6_HELCL|nr:hypothetical protein [Heliobacterium chlorum]MBC9784692.1 hypothetical protein [Heliobacterium chlorum]
MKKEHLYFQDKECGHPNHLRRTRGLVITYQCNLDCLYCYVSNKSDKQMPLDVAKQAIADSFVDRSGNSFQEVEIDFLGAEPLCAFDKIKEIALWMWSQPWPKPYILFATTNGTLLNEEMKDWFHTHRERFVLGLSYDGDEETQNVNRSDSSRQIDLDFFQKNWPQQPIKMTISEKTVHRLADGIIFLQEKGFDIHANPANGTIPWSEASIAEYSRQLAKLIDYYLDHPEVPRVSLLDVDLKTLLTSRSSFENKYCGAGVAFDVVDVDGKEYPCHLFSPLVLSKSKIYALRSLNFHAKEPFIDPKCKNCVLEHICPTCYGMNYRSTSNPALREVTLCKLYMLQILANSKLQAKILARKQSLSAEDKEIAYVIQTIYQLLNKKTM